jgi:hypothetical protein
LTILEEAGEIVNGRGQKEYGHPLDNWTQTAQLWSGILGRPVSAEQAVLCMMTVKLARESFSPKRDNRVDMVGFALVLDMILEERARRENDSWKGVDQMDGRAR